MTKLNQHSSPWTEAATETLKTLWAEHYTASEIQAKLGPPFTRNGILGKVHRLRLPIRAAPRPYRQRTQHSSPEVPVLARKPSSFVNKAHRPDFRPPDTVARVRYPKAPTVPLKPGKGPHATLEHRTGCCYPVNAGNPFLYCNTDTPNTYCDYHRGVMYQVPQAPVDNRPKT